MRGIKLKPMLFVNLAISISMGVFAQLCMKYGMNGLKKAIGKITFTDIFHILFVIFSDKFVLAGIVLYLISMFFWIKVLSKIDLSVAYPFVSVGVILTVILAAVMLGESIPFSRWAGIFITLGGVYIIIFSHEETSENLKK
ncbi:SMR family transporter [Candidatus Acidulodesulfobacterium sp. H_13]|uniref:SMR family transporter n=1 Tax=Candidatus Acidulodesulfobacterium sp. H_13 TaxID=3395470 RepID=UPI003AF65C8E